MTEKMMLVPCDCAATLIEEIGRHRALTREESEMLTTAIRKQGGRRIYVKWTPELDLQLIAASRSTAKLRAFIESIGISRWAAYSRLQRIKGSKA